MPKIEIVGQQLRIRVRNPSLFSKIKTDDVGKKGKFQRIAGYSKKHSWQIQSWRFNLSEYDSIPEFMGLINGINITEKQHDEAVRKAINWFHIRGI